MSVLTWIARLEATRSKVERDELLLRDLKDLRKAIWNGDHKQRERLLDEIEDQMRALASRLPVI